MNKIREIFNNSIPDAIRYNFKCHVWCMILTGLFCGCYANYYGVIAREHFHAGAFWIGLIGSACYITGLGGFWIASLATKGKEHIWCKNIRMISSLCLFGAAFVPNTYGKIFCLMCALLHIVAAYGPLENTVYGYIYTLEHRSRMLGYAKMFLAIFGTGMTFAMGFLIDVTYFGIQMWRLVFITGAIYFAFSGIFLGKMKLPNVKVETENSLKYMLTSIKLITEDRFNIILIISGIFFTIALTVFNTLYPMYQVDIMGIGGKEVGYIALVSSIINIVGFPILGTFYGKINPVKAWIFPCILMLIYPAFFLLTGTFWQSLLVGMIFWAGFNVTNEICWINLIIYLGGKNKIKEYQGLYGLIMGARGIIGLFVSAFIINHCEKLPFDPINNYRIAFLTGMACVIISLAIYLPMIKVFNKRETE